MITIFKNITSTKEPYFTSLDVILDRIKSGKSKDLVDKVRSIENKDDRDKVKSQLPSICFSGKFKERNAHSLLTHSGLICLDFDKVDLAKMTKKLKSDEFIHAFFISPSGNGIKALVKIPTDDHTASFYALEKRYPNLDKACKDVCRVCYESYDPKLYFNPDSELFTEKIEITYEQVTIDKPITDSDKIYDNLKKWLEKKGEYFTEGNRNNFLAKLLSACNRFGISKSTARDYALYDYVNGSTNFKIAELDSVANSVYSNYSNQFNTAGFDDKEVVEFASKKIVSQDILDFTTPPKDIIFLDDVYKDMREEFKNGIKKGATTHFKSVDENYRLTRGELTAIFGIGNHGKTHFLMHILMNRARFNGERFALFCPENYPAQRFYNQLVMIYAKGSVMNNAKNKISDDMYVEACTFVNEHFFYLFPENDLPTPEYVLERFRETIYKKKVDGVIIDPFNQMSHKKDGRRDDEYLSDIFTMFKRFASMEQIYFWIVAHPNGSVEKEDGDLKMPYFTQMAQGMMWANKMDNICCYHRPFFASNPSDPTCLFASQKIKDQLVNGVPGITEFKYDRETFTYVEGDGFNEPKLNDDRGIADNLIPMSSFKPANLEDETPF